MKRDKEIFKTKVSTILTYTFIVFCLSNCNKDTGNIQPIPIKKQFYSVQGTKILDADGKAIRLEGIAFGNEVWSDNELPLTHHSEVDYTRVKDMGMNMVRFYLNYKTFENDAAPYQYKQSGWDWIDQNIQWAQNNDILLLLNIHVPQGGFQSLGNSDALWEQTEIQNRLAALWKAIAQRYKDETQIIGFGLVNEPVPTSDIVQWQQLAQRLTDEIRQADTNHIIFIEKAIYVKGKPETTDYNFPKINDNNVVYEFHFYNPFEYTHQLFSWTNLGEGGKYPDESVVYTHDTQWYTATFNNPTLGIGTTDWQYFEGVKYTVNDVNIKIGIPALVAANVGGRVYFDNIEIKEFDPDGELVQTILENPLNNSDGWYYWSENNSGHAGLSNSTGISENTSLFIDGADGDCNYSNYKNPFLVKQGYSYQISGWMKGQNVSNNAACRLRIDFLTTDNPVFTRNKTYLEHEIKKYADWGQKNNVPIYMGEFGVGCHCFENNKGGLQWVSDMIDIAKVNGLHFSYHTYHEDNFGVYYGYGTLPDTASANKELINLFKEKLN
ncbi:MAG: glycoside hydrolase family 5 protein [Bacteroidales bacterium]|jgi:endoglucanase|nr:glycoside hydrolase family 5 protein [Bacteroidales bacterium]